MVSRDEITWEVLRHARQEFDALRQALGPKEYEREKSALKDYLCGYFSSGTCRHKQGNQISPMPSTLTGKGGRCLKVRWGLPGKGKSGGLRLAIVVYCERKHVKLCGAWRRNTDPSDTDFESAISDA